MQIIKSDWIDELQGDNIYNEDSVDMLVDEDGLSLEEAAFMQGYDQAG